MTIDDCFILGIGQRSGTNFLARLLQLHPECAHPGPIWEDFVVQHAHILDGMTRRLYSAWEPKWQVREQVGPPDVLMACLGDGLRQFLHRQLSAANATVGAGTGSVDGAPGRVVFVTKTPSVRNLEHFPRLFPAARLILVVRDGRAVVESRVKSFDWHYEAAMREWAAAARTILRFRAERGDFMRQVLLVRYEDLLGDLRRTLETVFRFLEVAPERFDFARAEALDVTGSSELRSSSGQAVHWEGVKKTASFNPLARFGNWPQARHDRFRWIAGREQELFDYELAPGHRTGAAHGLLNRVLDATYYVRIFPWLVRKGWPRIRAYLKR